MINFLEQLIKQENVELIFHAATYKHVNILEKNFSAVKNNIFATYNLCELSIKYSCEMILFQLIKQQIQPRYSITQKEQLKKCVNILIL